MSGLATSELAKIKVVVKHNYLNLFIHLANAFIRSVLQLGAIPDPA